MWENRTNTDDFCAADVVFVLHSGLGIPVMQDRALQALVKLALEPEWEAKFEANSYGFRPGRSCHDVLAAIRNSIMFKPKYVLDADIAKCFDRINHDTLLAKLNVRIVEA
jgi:RNA-directed DNA polymerase